ncbi:MAG: hypothetical protein Q8J83_10335, partial [Nitrosomonas sp.]
MMNRPGCAGDFAGDDYQCCGSAPALGAVMRIDRLPSFGFGGGHCSVKQQATQLGGPRLDRRLRPILLPESLALGSKPVNATNASALRKGTRSNVLVSAMPTTGPTPNDLQTLLRFLMLRGMRRNRSHG